jgi:hypothetical protein
MLGIAGVKNEQDIIEPFVRHCFRFLDNLIVLDNGSVDDTKRILKDLAREFGNLTVLEDDSFGNPQGERMTRLAQTGLSVYDPEYIVPLDADEFLDVTDKSELAGIFANIPAEGFGLIPWRTFVLTPDMARESPPDVLGSMHWRRRDESPLFYKAVLRVSSRTIDDVAIEHGSHSVRAPSGREIPSVLLSGINVLHFPVRSRDQFVGRIVVGWMANLTRDRKASSSGIAWQKRDNFERISCGDMIDETVLCECSLLYAQTPKPIDWACDVVHEHPRIEIVRQYSNGKAMPALQLVARSWEQSILNGNPGC